MNVSNYKAMIAQVLGPEAYQLYIEALRDLFGGKASKQAFDNLIAPFMTGYPLALHNEMVAMIITNCYKDSAEAETVPKDEDRNYQPEGSKSIPESEPKGGDKKEESPTVAVVSNSSTDPANATYLLTHGKEISTLVLRKKEEDVAAALISGEKSKGKKKVPKKNLSKSYHLRDRTRLTRSMLKLEKGI